MPLTPEIRSEVSGRLTGIADETRLLFGQSEVQLTGGELERLCIASFLGGYAAAIQDANEYGSVVDSPLGDACARAFDE